MGTYYQKMSAGSKVFLNSSNYRNYRNVNWNLSKMSADSEFFLIVPNYRNQWDVIRNILSNTRKGPSGPC